MPQYERQKNILDYLQSNHSATVKELAHAVYASEASVRRDIARLEASGHVERIYGSILLAGHENAVVPVGVREMSNISRKEIVAKMAAERIQPEAELEYRIGLLAGASGDLEGYKKWMKTK